MNIPMNQEQIAQLRAKAGLLYQHLRQCATRVLVKARVLLGLFLVAALIMAIHTALTAKDASLHLKLQHSVRVRIEPQDAAAMQEDSISGDISHNAERDLFVSARPSSLSLSWQGTGSAPFQGLQPLHGSRAMPARSS